MANPLTVRLPDETLDALDRLAAQTERSRSWLIGRAVEDYVALNQWQIGRINDGILDADAGTFASAADMKRIRGKHTRRS